MAKQLNLFLSENKNLKKNMEHKNMKKTSDSLNYKYYKLLEKFLADKNNKNNNSDGNKKQIENITCNKKLFANCIKNFKNSFSIFANVYENIENQIKNQQDNFNKKSKNEIFSEVFNDTHKCFDKQFYFRSNLLDDNNRTEQLKYDEKSFIIHWDTPILISNEFNNSQQNSLLAIKLFAKYFGLPLLIIDCNDINLYDTLFGKKNGSKSKILQAIEHFDINNVIITLTNFNHLSQHVESEKIIQKISDLFNPNSFDRFHFADTSVSEEKTVNIAFTNWILLEDENVPSLVTNKEFPREFKNFISINSISPNPNFSIFNLTKELTMLEQYKERFNTNRDVDNQPVHSDFIPLCDPNVYKKFMSELKYSSADSRTSLHELLRKNDVDIDKHYITLLPPDWKHKLNILRAKFPNFWEIVDFLDTQFRLQEITNNYLKFNSFVIVGPSGCGKTEFAVEFVRLFFPVHKLLNISQMDGGFALLGSGKQWGNTQMGEIYRKMLFVPELNPCFILDNIDCCGGEERFPVLPPLLNLLSATETQTITDCCVDFPIKGHFINYIGTAHKKTKIKPAIKEKIKIFEVKMPSIEKNKEIAKQIYIDLHNQKSYKDPTYFSEPLSEEILSKLSSTNPAHIKKLLVNAIGNAIKNNRYNINISDIDQKELNLHASSRLDETLEENKNLKIFELFSQAKFENLQKKVENNISDKSYVSTMEDVFDRMLSHDEYKLRQLPTNWRDIMKEFKERFPNFSDFYKYVCCQFAASEKGEKVTYWEPVLFTGEAGIGKTEAAKWLSSRLNVEYIKIDMQNADSNEKLVGNSKNSGSNAKPGKIFDLLVSQPISNPIIVLDELEKSANEKAMNSLYTLLERSTAKEFKDEFCDDLPLNASYISFIATTNSIDKLSAPLLSRFKVLHIERPTAKQCKDIAKNIYDQQVKENGYKKSGFMTKSLTDEMLDKLSHLTPREIVKKLKEAIGKAANDGHNELDIMDFKDIVAEKENGRIGFY